MLLNPIEPQRWLLDLSYCKVIAPFPSRVINLNISAGAYASAGTPVFSLLDTRHWYVMANFRPANTVSVDFRPHGFHGHEAKPCAYGARAPRGIDKENHKHKKQRTMTKMDYDFDNRPITIVGAGTLGRRIALMLSTRGGEVRIFDKDQKSRDEGVKYVADMLPQILSKVPGMTPVKVFATNDLAKSCC